MKLILMLLLTGVLMSSGPIVSGTTTCPTSGSKRVTATAPSVITYTIQTPIANAGTIYVGDSTVSATTGVALAPGMSYTAPPAGNSNAYGPSAVWFACGTNTDKITWIYQ
jgi:hypothetical protein